MQRHDITLLMLALAEGRPYSPVQIQKAMFLADDKIPEAFDSRYHFEPYDYGPFDRHVYIDIEDMQERGLTEIRMSPRGWNLYEATREGQGRASALSGDLTAGQRVMLRRISRLVLSLSFSDLLSAIYKGYPHMRERSVFRD